MSEGTQRLKEIADDARADSEAYAEKATKAGEGEHAEYCRGASWAFDLIAQRIDGEIAEILYA